MFNIIKIDKRSNVLLWAFKDVSSNAHALPQSSQNIVRSWWNVLSLNIGMGVSLSGISRAG